MKRLVSYEVQIFKLDYEITFQLTRLGGSIQSSSISPSASTNFLVLNILYPSLSTFPLLQMSMVT